MPWPRSAASSTSGGGRGRAGASPPRRPEAHCEVVADIYPALAEEEAGATLGAGNVAGLALAAHRVQAPAGLRALEPLDAGQRGWRDATEQAICFDDGPALAGELAELQARIGGAWPFPAVGRPYTNRTLRVTRGAEPPDKMAAPRPSGLPTRMERWPSC